MKLNKISLAKEYFEECSKTPSDVNFTPLIENYLASIPPYQKPDTLSLAKTFLRKNAPNKAIQLLTEQTKTNVNTQILLAQAYMQANLFDEAREVLFSILKVNAAHIEASLCLCKLCVLQNDLLNLATILSNLSTIPPNFNHYMQISHYYCLLSNWNDAIINYQNALQVFPYSVEAETLLSLCYLNNQNKTEALFHIGQAKWIDIENPIVNELGDLIQNDALPIPVKVEFKIPQNLVLAKQDEINLALNNQFCKSMLSSPWLATDVEWGLSTHNPVLTQKLSFYLSKCKQTRLVDIYKRHLLSTRTTKNQKFFFIKHAILHKNLKIIHFTTDFRIKTFRYSLPKKIPSALQNSYTSALSYAAIFDIFIDFKTNFELIFQCYTTHSLSENETTCLFFIQNELCFQNACIFFRCDAQKLYNLWNKNEFK